MERVNEEGQFVVALVDRQWLAPGIVELRLRRPADLRFIPGQYMRFVMDGYERDYTMVSAPDAGSIDFCVALVDQGRFSGDILSAAVGTPLRLSGPHGYFIFQPPVYPAVFVATGTGVAPFAAFCRSGDGDALLLHGVETPDRLIYRDLFQSTCRGYVPCISHAFQPDDDLEPTFSGRVTDYLMHRLKAGSYDFYLCGRRSMIRDAVALIDEKFVGSRLFIEPYD